MTALAERTGASRKQGDQVGYSIEGVVGSAEVLSAAAAEHPEAVVVPLAQGFGLVPMTDALFDSISDGRSSRPFGFWKFPGGFELVLCTWSLIGPVAFLEAEYFGGVGRQQVAVWARGSLALGPLSGPAPAGDSPISQALAFLGVKRGDHYDEFDALGLNRYRETADWLP
jgi:hypothetical protein